MKTSDKVYFLNTHMDVKNEVESLHHAETTSLEVSDINGKKQVIKTRVEQKMHTCIPSMHRDNLQTTPPNERPDIMPSPPGSLYCKD